MNDSNLQSEMYSRWSAIKNDRSSFITRWKEISESLLPFNGKFFVQDRHLDGKSFNSIYDSSATGAQKILSAGMMAGMTSPARPWFKLAVGDQDLMQFEPVKIWLNKATRRMLSIFAKSNTYRSFHSMYEELSGFGTSADIVMSDFDTVIHHQTLTAGEYGLAQDFKGRVDSIYREFEKPVAAIVKEFGINNVSQTVKRLYENGQLDSWVTLMHVIEPREDRDVRKKDAKNMRFKSVYFETGNDKGKYLSESGFKRFPALCPRWSLIGGGIYGVSPAMEALGDIRQLQHEQLRKAEVIDYQTKPPLQVPGSMKNREIDSLPGGISFTDISGQGIKTMFDVNLRLDYLLQDIQDVRRRIDARFNADLFLMISQSTNTQMTATEVAERHEEKLLMLGPVLERLHNEMLEPLINQTFDYMIEAGLLADIPPPPELQGQEINIEFVSMLAQAQRAIGVNATDRFVGSLGVIAGFKPDVTDKFNSDRWAEIHSEMLGVDPEMIVADEQVAIIRKERAQQQAMAQRAEVMKTMAGSAKDMSQVDTQNKNGLTDLMNQFSGYTIPQGEYK